jgi:hypothetical protein
MVLSPFLTLSNYLNTPEYLNFTIVEFRGEGTTPRYRLKDRKSGEIKIPHNGRGFLTVEMGQPISAGE